MVQMEQFSFWEVVAELLGFPITGS